MKNEAFSRRRGGRLALPKLPLGQAYSASSALIKRNKLDGMLPKKAHASFSPRIELAEIHPKISELHWAFPMTEKPLMVTAGQSFTPCAISHNLASKLFAIDACFLPFS